jgi:hypothetical protein
MKRSRASIQDHRVVATIPMARPEKAGQIMTLTGGVGWASPNEGGGGASTPRRGVGLRVPLDGHVASDGKSDRHRSGAKRADLAVASIGLG